MWSHSFGVFHGAQSWMVLLEYYSQYEKPRDQVYNHTQLLSLRNATACVHIHTRCVTYVISRADGVIHITVME